MGGCQLHVLVQGGKSKRWEVWKRRKEHAGELGPGVNHVE